MFKVGLIESSTTEWVSPLVFVPKKDVTQIFFVYYRKLKSVNISNSYPIPRMYKCIDSLG